MGTLPLILIPGMMCDARLFHPQIAAFSGCFSLHLPPISQHDSVEAIAAEILKNAPPQFALAGLSMGGIVAMEVLRQAPDRVERLALLNTNPRAEADHIKEKRQPQLEAVERGDLSKVLLEQMIPLYTYDRSLSADIETLALNMGMDLGGDVFVRQSMALMKRRSQIDTLATYKGKSLVLTGEADVLCPLDRHQQMAELLSNSTLEVIPAAGHLTTLEQPERTNAALKKWLED